MPVIWILGISAQIDRIDTEIMRHEIDDTRSTWRFIEPLVSETWTVFWLYCLVGGIIGGALYYWIAGWWYGLRVRWSGAGEDFDKQLARRVYCWSSMILAMPHVVLTIGFTFFFPNYLAAYHSGETISLILPIMMFWSVAVSYTGVTESFSLTPWKARLWFLVFPALFHLFVLGFIIFLLTFFS